jgi:hypothetical protein
MIRRMTLGERPIALLRRQANEVSNKARERATWLVNKLGGELRAVEDRVKEKRTSCITANEPELRKKAAADQA